MVYEFTPHGVCSRAMEVEIEDGKIKSCRIIGGCSGNSQGICALVKGMDAQEAIERLEGIRCGFKPTSCPDQLSKALKKAMEEK